MSDGDSYTGQPGYPAPYATKTPREGLRDEAKARIVSLAPDVCLTPVGNSVVPIPYPVVDNCGDDSRYTPSVRFTGQKAMVMRSNTTCVHGDEPGTKKGVKSGTVGDICEPIGNAQHVRAEGSEVIRHLDRFHMNKRNTVGEAIFVKSMATPAALVDTDPIPGSLRLAAMNAQALPAPQPAPVPSPNPPGQVIRPDVPQWRTPPPTQPQPRGPNPNIARLGKFGARLFGFLGLLLHPSPLGDGTIPRDETVPLWQFDLDSSNPQRRRAAEEAQRRYIENPDLRYDLEDWYLEEVEPLPQPEALNDPETGDEADEQPVPAPLPNVRVDEDEGSQRECKVGPYEDVAPICNGEAHHIVPDFAYRLGTRPTLAAERASTANRIPNAPTFNQGMSICLTREQHGSGEDGLHGQMRAPLRALGEVSPVPGTAPMGAILAESVRQIEEIPSLPEECKQLAVAMTTGQVLTQTGTSAPGRTLEAPLPSGEARRVLSQGHY